MADASLSPASPLDALVLPSSERFALAEAPPMGRYIFRVDVSFRDKLERAFGVELPTQLGAAAERDGRTALWLGPDEWLLLAIDVDPELFPAEVAAALNGAPHSLVDVSHRQLGLVVSGAGAPRALSTGCPLDLRDRSFPIGFATRTLFDKAEIVLWRRGPATYHIEVWRSFSPYLAAALIEVARGAPSR
jgi:sarcosine oxidase, subunit gamma